jgi:hypothetical protein
VASCRSSTYHLKVLANPRLATFSLMLLSAQPFAAAYARDYQAVTVEYGCQDVVVIGRIRTLSYTDLTTSDDILGHGQFSMRVDVKRLVRGRLPQRSVAVSRIAHGQLRNDRDFLVVMSPAEGEYTLKSAALWGPRPHPRVSDHCTHGG